MFIIEKVNKNEKIFKFPKKEHKAKLADGQPNILLKTGIQLSSRNFYKT